MSDVRDRHALREALEPTLGPGPTALLLEHLPPMPDELATKAHLRDLEARTDRRFEAVDARFDAVDAVDARFDAVDARFDSLERTFDAKLEALEHRVLAAFRLELTHAITAQTRTVVFSTLGAVVSLGGMALALAAWG